MAEAEEATPKAEGEGKKASGNMKKIIMLVGGVLALVGASVGGTLFFLMPDENVEGDSENSTPTIQAAIYHNLKPSFVVTFMAGDKPRFVQADLAVISREQAAIGNVIAHAPLLRGQIIALFTDQDYVELQTDKGKSDLQKALTKLINETLSNETGSGDIESVLLTNFVMQ